MLVFLIVWCMTAQAYTPVQTVSQPISWLGMKPPDQVCEELGKAIMAEKESRFCTFKCVKISNH